MILDAHLHLGRDYLDPTRSVSEQQLLDAMERNGLDGCVLYPGRSNLGLAIERENHKVVKDFMDTHEHVYGICMVNPHIGAQAYKEEIKRYKNEGFSGICVDPLSHGWDPKSEDGEMVFQTASQLNLPLFIVEGYVTPYGIPARLFEICLRYPDVRVVIVHAGRFIYDPQYKILGRECPNIYFETSHGPRMRDLKKYVRLLGSKRVFYGSDTLEDIDHIQYMYRHAQLTEEETADCMGNAIVEFFAKGGKTL